MHTPIQGGDRGNNGTPMKRYLQQLTTFSLLIFLLYFSFATGAIAEEVALDSVIDTQQQEQIEKAPSEETVIEPSVDVSEEMGKKEEDSEEKLKPGEEIMSSLSSPTPAQNTVQLVAPTKLPSPDKITGAMQYEIPIVVPPGRNGLQPDLKLTYSSQARKYSNTFGYGWDSNIPYIERINRTGTDALYSDNYFTSSLGGELATTTGGAYVSKVDNGDYLQYAYSNNSWVVTDKKGTRYTFGTTTAARLDNAADTSQVFRWMLEEVRDTNDNYIKYQYYKHAGQIYPSAIIYTGSGSTDGIFQIDFLRQSRSDVVKSYSTGFLVQTSYRINKIEVKVNSTLRQGYNLSFGTADNGVHTTLTNLAQSGVSETSVTTNYPTTTFAYQRPVKSWATTTSWSNLPVFTAGGETMIDINGDALPDRVVSRGVGGSATQMVYLNTGTTWTDASSWTIPGPLNDPANDLGYRFGDVNGDGLPDILHSTTDYCGDPDTVTREVFLNTGSNWVLNASSTIPIDFLTASAGCGGFVDQKSQLVDVNGDGLVDIVSTPPGGSGYVYLNKGSRWVQQSGWSPQVGNGLTHIDLNGDGLADRIYTSGNGPYAGDVYINKGGTWDYDSGWGSVPCPINMSDYDEGCRLGDINGDDLPDILQAIGNPAGSVTKNVYINTGTAWTLDNTWSIPGVFVYVAGGPAVKNVSDVVDVNGDGLSDVIANNGSVGQAIYFNNGPQANLLSRIQFPKGGSTTVSYKASTQYTDSGGTFLNSHLPLTLPTVNALGHSDGLGTVGTTTYSYKDGRYYYASPFDKKFTGFNLVTETEPTGNMTEAYFHQGNTSDTSHGEYNDTITKAGKLYGLFKYNSSGSLYAKTLNRWDSYDRTNGATFVKLTQKVDSTYDGDSSHKDAAESYVYDDSTGNLTTKTLWGEVTGSTDGSFSDTGSDKYVTTIAYAASGGSQVTGLPSTETTEDQSSNKVSELRHYYDTLSLGSVDKGNETKLETWKSSSTYINTQKTYNSYGLVTMDQDGRGKQTTYSYDTYNLNVATSTNPLSQATAFWYDYLTGAIKQVTDPNKARFIKSYDGLGRVLSESQTDMSSPLSTITTKTYSYDTTSFPQSSLMNTNLDSGFMLAETLYTYFDGLGRTIQERRRAETSNTYAIKDYVYNSSGLLYKESLPYFGTGTARSAATTTSALFKTFSYDPLQRVTSVVDAAGTTATSYDDWKSTVTDALSKVKSFYKDAYNNLVRVDEINGGSTYSTYYEYNGLKNLTKITDVLGNIRSFTYDGLGRRLTAEDLHASADGTFGAWTYAYDDASNLSSAVTPLSQTVNYTYDDLNRVLTEDYTGAAGTEVTYAYDTCPYGKTRFCFATTTAAITNYEYNPIGLIKKETRKIGGTTYITSYTYDRRGNILTITYPDNAQTQYTYNVFGAIDKIERKESGGSFTNVVSNIDYSPLGQITVLGFGNNATTTNTYSLLALYRLSNKTTLNAGATKLQDTTYTYDAVGNITRIVDASATNGAKTVDYIYDDLHRLTSATATSTANGQNYTQTYSYDAVGNITNKSDQGTYLYEGNTGSLYANPHAATSIASTTLTYDMNGNLTALGPYAYTWDYNNRLTRTATGTATSTYFYDHAGARVSLTVGSATTTYPNRHYNIIGTKKTKHIYAGDLLVGTVETTGIATSTYYVHTDTLLGSNVISDSTGAKNQLLDYYPFGSVRLNEQATAFNEQRKYIGQEYDTDTGLSYLNARYYEGGKGRFMSQDSSHLAIGNSDQVKQITGLDQQTYLMDPQALNSYSYARNNPIALSDPQGKFAPALGVLAIPGIGEAAVIGGVGLLGATAVYYGTQAILNSDSWGGRYGGQVPILDPAKLGFGKPPMGPEDMNWSNLNPRSPKTWIAAGLIVGAVIKEGKEAIDTTKEWVRDIFKGNQQNSNKSSSVQVQQKDTQQRQQQTIPSPTKKENKNKSR